MASGAHERSQQVRAGRLALVSLPQSNVFVDGEGRVRVGIGVGSQQHTALVNSSNISALRLFSVGNAGLKRWLDK